MDYEVFAFSQMRQIDGEQLDEFVVRLRVAAIRCEFGTATDAELKRQIIRGCSSSKLRQHILETPAITLKLIQEKARAAEASVVQTKAIERQGKLNNDVKQESVAAVTNKAPTRPPHRGTTFNRLSGSNSGRRQTPGNEERAVGKPKKCFACGYDFPHTGECPAANSKCRKCQQKGHFAKSRLCGKSKVNSVEEQNEEEDADYIFAIGSGGQQPQVDVEIDGVTIHALIDSGAQVNLIDQATFESFSRKPTLEPAKGKLYAYQTDKPISVKGQFNATVQANGHKTEASFKVVDGRAGNLLSFATARICSIPRLFNDHLKLPQ